MRIKISFFGAILAVTLLIAGCNGTASSNNTTAQDDSLHASGMIEAEQVSIASEIGGQVVEVLVEEGESVEAGDVLIRLDDTALQMQYTQAEFTLEIAESQLHLIETGATDEQLIAAKAQVDAAEANLAIALGQLYTLTDARPDELSAACQNLERAWARYYQTTVQFSSDQEEAVRELLDSAEDNLSSAEAWKRRLEDDDRTSDYALDTADTAIHEAEQVVEQVQSTYDILTAEDVPYYLQIESLRLSVELADANVGLSRARLDGLKKQDDILPEAIDAAESVLENAEDLAEIADDAYSVITTGSPMINLDAVWAEVEDAQEELAGFVATQGLNVSVEVLLAQVDAAYAARDLALAQQAELENGAKAEEIAIAEAQVDQAHAVLDMLESELRKLTITAPIDGVIVNQIIYPGELALPGATLLQIADLDHVKLTVFIPENQFGRVHYGQEADVSIDTFPDRTFTGEITFIADQAEFTPENVQTEEQRVNLVYAVEISLENSDHTLKQGMFADVTLLQSNSSTSNGG